MHGWQPQPPCQAEGVATTTQAGKARCWEGAPPAPHLPKLCQHLEQGLLVDDAPVGPLALEGDGARQRLAQSGRRQVVLHAEWAVGEAAGRRRLGQGQVCKAPEAAPSYAAAACRLPAHLCVQHLPEQVCVLSVQECAHPARVHILDHQHPVKGHPGIGRIPLQWRGCSKGALAQRTGMVSRAEKASRRPAGRGRQGAGARAPPRSQHGSHSPIWSTICPTSCCHMMGGRFWSGPTPSAVASVARTHSITWQRLRCSCRNCVGGREKLRSWRRMEKSGNSISDQWPMAVCGGVDGWAGGESRCCVVARKAASAAPLLHLQAPQPTLAHRVHEEDKVEDKRVAAHHVVAGGGQEVGGVGHVHDVELLIASQLPRLLRRSSQGVGWAREAETTRRAPAVHWRRTGQGREWRPLTTPASPSTSR